MSYTYTADPWSNHPFGSPNVSPWTARDKGTKLLQAAVVAYEPIPEHAEALAELRTQLRRHAGDVPCTGPQRRAWLAEGDPDATAYALAHCRRCPVAVRAACARVGEYEDGGLVYGGQVRQPARSKGSQATPLAAELREWLGTGPASSAELAEVVGCTAQAVGVTLRHMPDAQAVQPNGRRTRTKIWQLAAAA